MKRKSSRDILEFYLGVIKNERVFGPQKIAFEETRREWVFAGKEPVFETWNAFRCGKFRMRENGYSFWVAKADLLDLGLTIVNTFTNENDARGWVYSVSSKVSGPSTVRLMTSDTGRVDESAVEVEVFQFNKP